MIHGGEIMALQRCPASHVACCGWIVLLLLSGGPLIAAPSAEDGEDEAS